jgi:hypothetical protein
MRIWVIGADPVARALGRSWVQAGHQVLFTFGDRVDWNALVAETGGCVATLGSLPVSGELTGPQGAERRVIHDRCR